VSAATPAPTAQAATRPSPTLAPVGAVGAPVVAGVGQPSRKLSYKEQRELEALPSRIEALEAEQNAIDAQLADGALYASDPPRAAALAARHAQIEEELMVALERWEMLGAR
jgi:ATP-binding cassette subfamily F protein uup